jgi:transcription antitermination protein NusB
MLREPTRRRARTLQLLYALDSTNHPDIDAAAHRLARLTGERADICEAAARTARQIIAHREALDRRAADAAEHWRPERIAMVERNILRLAIHELECADVPARVVIDEALWLTHRFAGPRAPAFINGVLDRVARELGRLSAAPAR